MPERNATTEQVAAALHVKPATVRKYARNHLIPFDTTPGGHRRFDVDEAVASITAAMAGNGDQDPHELTLDVPYVRVEPQHSVTVICEATIREHPPVGSYDTDEEREVWGMETPVV